VSAADRERHGARLVRDADRADVVDGAEADACGDAGIERGDPACVADAARREDVRAEAGRYVYPLREIERRVHPCGNLEVLLAAGVRAGAVDLEVVVARVGDAEVVAVHPSIRAGAYVHAFGEALLREDARADEVRVGGERLSPRPIDAQLDGRAERAGRAHAAIPPEVDAVKLDVQHLAEVRLLGAVPVYRARADRVVAAEGEDGDDVVSRQVVRRAALIVPVPETHLGRERRQDGPRVPVPSRDEHAAARRPSLLASERSHSERSDVEEAQRPVDPAALRRRHGLCGEDAAGEPAEAHRVRALEEIDAIDERRVHDRRSHSEVEQTGTRTPSMK
jgi:hypothetical protein